MITISTATNTAATFHGTFGMTTPRISCDMETYSAVDLRAAGLHNYATDASTGIFVMTYGYNEDLLSTWIEGQPFPADLREHVEGGGILTAWNAAFEISLWSLCAVRRYGWPPVRVDQWRCSMAVSYATGLPGALENAAPALGIVERKDAAGKRVMLQLSKPKPDGSMWRPEDDPAKFAALYAYNVQDVRTEMACLDRMLPLSGDEQALWVLDQTINGRGIMVDTPSVEAGIALVMTEKQRLDAEIRTITGGVVSGGTNLAQLKNWIKFRGVPIDGLAKADITALLDTGIPPDVRRALVLRQESGKSSTAKLTAMIDRASPDGRLRDTLQFHGASTGRWAGRGVQVQNLPRGKLKPHEVEEAIALFGNREMLDMLYGAPLDVLSSCLRGMLVPAPGNEFLVCDYANIEGRVLAWLADETWKLDAFKAFDAGTGPDLYLVAAGGLYGVPHTEAKPHRQEGKVVELGMGFGGGANAARTMAKTYGVDLERIFPGVWARASFAQQEAATKSREFYHKTTPPDEQMSGPAFFAGDLIKQTFRSQNPAIVAYWTALDYAAIEAVMNPGRKVVVSTTHAKITFLRNGSFLFCRLPSGRVNCYPFPSIKEGKFGGDSVFYWRQNQTTNHWEETGTYGGKLAENVTQAVARDVLVVGIRNLERNAFPVVFHTHDEAVSETPIGAKSVKQMQVLMCLLPAWAAGLPVAAEGWHGARYRK